MWQARWIVLLAVSTAAFSGCGKSATENSGKASAPNGVENRRVAANGGPEATVKAFLEALRSGDDRAVSGMLTTTAREKNASLSGGVTPPPSDTAKFMIGKVDYVNDDGARVACTLSDTDEDGEVREDRLVWVLRCEDGQWRVAGLAVEIFPGESPLLLNFEDPEDIQRKTQWVREEVRRRMESDSELQAQDVENEKNTLRR